MSLIHEIHYYKIVKRKPAVVQIIISSEKEENALIGKMLENGISLSNIRVYK